MKYKFFNKTGLWIAIIFIIVITAAVVVDLALFWDIGAVAIIGFIFAWALCCAVILRSLLLLPIILIDADGVHLYAGKRIKQEIKWKDLVEIKSYYKNKQKNYMIYAKDNAQPLNVQFRLNNVEFEKTLKQFTTVNIQESDF
ncbi:MAG: hypothetical protein K2L12_04755 [Clostridia bacterium]|nr:hypothetical protein [Clostridia bacterium]